MAYRLQLSKMFPLFLLLLDTQLVICFIPLFGDISRVFQIKQHVSCTSCRHLSHVAGGAPKSKVMHVHRPPSLRAEQSGIMKQSGRPLSHMLTVSLCALSLCIMVILLPFFLCPLSTNSASQHHVPLCFAHLSPIFPAFSFCSQFIFPTCAMGANGKCLCLYGK